MLTRLLFWLVRLMLSLRYRIHIKGLEKITTDQLNPNAGILFLPNHVAFIDPLILISTLWNQWKPRSLVIEYVYYTFGLHWVFSKLLRTVPIPDFQNAMNSYKLRRVRQAIDQVSTGLKNRDNFVVYPAGRLKRSAEESLGGASAVYEILQKTPQANVILVRTVGLWGSIFGWGLTGSGPNMTTSFIKGLKILLKNLIFFTPRRTITIELEIAPSSIMQMPSRTELNQYLESWYNRPFNRPYQPGEREAEPLALVSYSCWKEELPKVVERPVSKVDLQAIPPEVVKKIRTEISRLSKRPESEILPEMRLFADLGLDSLDIADLISSIDREVLHATISLFDQVTVGELMAMAAGHVLEQGGAPSPIKLKKKWFEQCKRPPPIFAKGETFQEVFLRSCARMNSYVACADAVAGIMTYSAVKMRVLLLAAHIRKLPSPHVGIMLPSSTAAQILIFATLMAKKIPVMINWTLGARYLEAVKKILNIDSILSSKAFLDRLENADVAPIDPLIKTLEMLRFEISIWDKIKAFCQSRLPVHTILKQCKVDKVSPDDIAVILFTSGTEALPKAVPLSHANLLSNQKEAAASISVGPGDIMMSFLPPFHSLGFSITGLVPLNMGMKVVYSPNPNDSLRLGREIEQYGTTIVCSAPTFLKNIFHVTQPEQLRSVRMFICGAEAVSKELFDKVHQLGNDAVLLEGYGITECGPILTVNRSHKPCKGVGLPMPGVELCIVHPDTHELLSTGSTGLILARSPGIFRGYLGDVKSPFIQVNGKNWYSTGDLGHLDKDGYLILEGRLKRFVKMGGEMISLPAVEAALLEAFKNKSEAPALAVIASLQSNDRPTLSLFANFVVEVDEANQALKQMGFSNLVKINDSHFLKTMPLTGAGKNDYLYLQTLVKQ